MPIFLNKPFDNRPYISITLYDESITCLLDTGANLTCLGKLSLGLLRKHKIKLDKCANRIITTADGKPQSIIGVCQLPIYLNNTCKLINVSVVPSLRCGIILGSDFCKTFKLDIHFKDNSWNVPSELSNLLVLSEDDISSQCEKQDKVVLTTAQQRELDSVVSLFRDLSPENNLGRTHLMAAHIETGDAPPFKQRQYRLSPYMLEHLNVELDKMLAFGVVEESFSNYNSPVLLTKKSSGDWRFCFDGRFLNKVTKKDSYPLPLVDDILKMLSNAKYISSIDLKNFFWQIPLDESSREKTAFSVPGRGLFHFKVLPFGLCNSSQIAQRLMDKVFSPKYSERIFVYCDDVILTSNTFAEHIELLKEVHEQLSNANLTVNFRKCQFLRKSLKYLGYVVDSQGLRTSSEKIRSIVEYPQPKNATEIRRFVGLCSWFRRFISHFSALIKPLNELLKGRQKRQSISWNDQAEKSFREIKQRLISAPILAAPDFSLEFMIHADASCQGLGAMLTQVHDGSEVVIAYASKGLSRAERNYSVTELEIYAVVFACETFKGYIQGVHFKVITDHACLRYLDRLSNPSGRLCRWSLRLSMYDFEVIHRKGKLHVVPDALSRAPPVEVNTLGISLENLDPWYLKMRENVIKMPEKYPQWLVKDNYLYKFTSRKVVLKTNISDWKLVVPESQRPMVIYNCHDVATSAHLGVYKTLKKISEDYYWPHLRQSVLKYVRRCETCGREKSPNTQRFGLMGAEKKATFPFEYLCFDTKGPMTRSKKGNQFLLVAADYFSKYVIMKPVRRATAEAIVIFLESIFLTYGVPRVLSLDNAAAHKGKVFKDLVKRYEIPQVFYNLNYHPAPQLVERVNRTIGQALRSLLKGSQKNWDVDVSSIQMALNTAVHEVTGFTPAYLVFGRKLPIRGTYYDNNHNSNLENLEENRRLYAEEMSKLPEIFKTVQERLSRAYQNSAARYNLRRREHVFKVGTRVWRRNFALSNKAEDFSAKLANRYVMCTIRKVLSNVAYEVENSDGTVGRFHVSQLKPYYGSNSDVSQIDD